MIDRTSSRPPLITLVDEVHRLGGRLKSLFGDARRVVDLGDSELMVLNAVVEADRPPTVSQIGRSLGQPRQIVQRAANALLAAKLIATASNPDHKRAPLLLPTEAGVTIKRQADERADAIAGQLAADFSADDLRNLAQGLNQVRRQLEAQIREGDF